MLLGDNERFMIKCQVTLKRYPEDAPDMPLINCIPVLKNRFLSSEAVYELNKGRSVIRLLALQDDGEYLKLLFQYINKDASDPAFSNIKTGATRIEKKQNDEGMGYSAHLLIKKTPSDPHFPDSYEAVLEEVPGITRALLAQALTAFLRENNFSFIRKDGKKELKCRPIFEIDFLAATTLEQSLSTGYLCGLIATRRFKDSSLDDDGTVMIEEETLKLATKIRRGEGAIRAIKAAYDKLRGRKFTTLRISYKDKNKRVSSDIVTIGKEMSLQELATAQLAHRDKAVLATTIAVCQTSLHAELLGKMQAFMVK
ncbi:hypothetical protein ACK86U_003163 [Salmonella enterica]|uniref:Uncharacterized protein n=3 Tax=Salmonella enterica TaxID=28901 RepID=A0A3Y9C6U4_SALEB|nr:hypothetical protein [Salmonella enterica subsp. enterica serovar Sandiego]EAA1980844.1 hypothetical protein [Salmonella enterica subsp. enterica serovar Java]EAO1476425.1 hypothetical protein [Salmonella enterica]HCM8924242.1 hypothetical protein [Salmonella enterica subsp. enterica serovar Paratyphi B]EAB8479734.1 hypothetical protein [Salmonella enterica subsp. enterica serovar Java]